MGPAASAAPSTSSSSWWPDARTTGAIDACCVWGLWGLPTPNSICGSRSRPSQYRATHYDCRPSVTSRHGQPMADRLSGCPAPSVLAVATSYWHVFLSSFRQRLVACLYCAAPHSRSTVSTLLSRRRSCTAAKIQVSACFQEQSTRGELY